MQPVPFAGWSTFFMFTTCVLCALGLLSRSFKDNLFQTIGMFCGMIGCGSRFVDLWGTTYVPLDWFLVHCCMGLFGLGVAWKVISRAHKEKFDRIAAGLRATANYNGWQRRDPIPSGTLVRRHDDP